MTVADTTKLGDTSKRAQLCDPDLGAALVEALQAPELTRSIRIDFGIDDIVRVTFETMPGAEQLRALGEVLIQHAERERARLADPLPP